MITAQDIHNKALEIARENPDFNYLAWIEELVDKDESIASDDCVYFVDANMPGCIYGRALDALGFQYEYFRRTDTNDGVGITSLVKRMMDDGFIQKEPFGLDNSLAREMYRMQSQQDEGRPWGDIVEELTE